MINKNKKKPRELLVIALVHLNIGWCTYTEKLPKSPQPAVQDVFEILMILSIMSLSTDHFFPAIICLLFSTIAVAKYPHFKANSKLWRVGSADWRAGGGSE